MTEDEVIERLWDDFRGDLCERIKFVKVHCKGDYFGDQEDLLWHFTRLSALRSILTRREVWLSDLAHCNDENEIAFGMSHVSRVVRDVTSRWSNAGHAATVRKVARRALRRFKTFQVFALSLSEERDRRQHWEAYGGGLQRAQDAGDPHIAIGFDAQALAHPLELSNDPPPAFLLNTMIGRDGAQCLANYWALKSRSALEVLEAGRAPLTRGRLEDALARMLVFACALAKSEGWQDEHEYRLLLVEDSKFGEGSTRSMPRPGAAARYVPLAWLARRRPIRAVMPHPLADAAHFRAALRALPGGSTIKLLRSQLRPRPR